MNIVIDTNIWISGLLWRGPSRQLLKLAESGVVTICVTYAMLLELEEVLSYERLQPRLEKLGLTPSYLAAFALQLSRPYDVNRVWPPIVPEDPDDDIFLLTALKANATYIVSADRHLRKLKTYEGIPIVQVDEFLEQFE